MKNGKISVALCTYNGAAFLEEQLECINSQTHPPCELIVCDDASSDSTIDIINSFIIKAGFPVRVYQNYNQLGVVANYSKAISLCSGEYVALCDQDDLWLPDKLQLSISRIKDLEHKYGTETPVLFHSDMKVIDKNNSTLASSFFTLRNLRPKPKEPLKVLLTQNYVTGCTVSINRALIDLALPIPPEALMHDWWLALVAAATGHILFESIPTVLYRRHDQNVIGAKGFITKENIYKVVNLNSLERELAGTIDQAWALRSCLYTLPDYRDISFLDSYYESLSAGGMKAAYYVVINKIRKIGWFRNIVFILVLLRGRYRKLIDV